MADLAQLRAEAQDLEAEVPNEELRDLVVRFRHLIDRLAVQEAIELLESHPISGQEGRR